VEADAAFLARGDERSVQPNRRLRPAGRSDTADAGSGPTRGIGATSACSRPTARIAAAPPPPPPMAGLPPQGYRMTLEIYYAVVRMSQDVNQRLPQA
jgi:hypothetical protein